MNEFSLINDLIKTAITNQSPNVHLSIGDDCAITSVPSGMQLAISTDTLVEGQHFFKGTCAKDIGYKALAVNLSDLAAMGASPAWALLNLTLPSGDPAWIKAFMSGFSDLAKVHHVALIGGDTTCGPLCISVQIAGFLKKDQGLLRKCAKPNDGIFVTGSLGAAALAAEQLISDSHAGSPPHKQNTLAKFLHRPTPRVLIGEQLHGIASACIDLSDGLSSDLSHILSQSQVGAIICQDKIPINPKVLDHTNQTHALQLALNGGDDYELCFTAATAHGDDLARISKDTNTPISCIGHITKSPGLYLQDHNNLRKKLKPGGFVQF